ncbi:MAG: hypothetical protein WKF86_05315 [Acidimicrobiales bacterium]
MAKRSTVAAESICCVSDSPSGPAKLSTPVDGTLAPSTDAVLLIPAGTSVFVSVAEAVLLSAGDGVVVAGTAVCVSAAEAVLFSAGDAVVVAGMAVFVSGGTAVFVSAGTAGFASGSAAEITAGKAALASGATAGVAVLTKPVGAGRAFGPSLAARWVGRAAGAGFLATARFEAVVVRSVAEAGFIRSGRLVPVEAERDLLAPVTAVVAALASVPASALALAGAGLGLVARGNGGFSLRAAALELLPDSSPSATTLAAEALPWKPAKTAIIVMVTIVPRRHRRRPAPHRGAGSWPLPGSLVTRGAP